MEHIKYFFSYSTQNSEFVINLATHLKEVGANVWLDKIDILPGSRWDDCIQNALSSSSGLLIVLSMDSVQSQNVLDEVSYAISHKKRIIPILIEDCKIPFRLARFQHIDFTGEYDIGFRQLIKTINVNQPASEIVKYESEAFNKLNSKVKPDLKNTNSSFETQQKENSFKSIVIKNIAKLIGSLFIILAVIISLFKKCPTNVQYFIVYALIGIGVALLLAKSAEKTIANVKVYNAAIAIGSGVALPFILFFTNPIASFKPDDCNRILNTTSATVFVHGKKGKQDMILRQKGFVIMDLGGERKRASINENGQAFFQNLHFGDSIRLDIDFSEPYKTIYPDSIYIIQANGNIYLQIALQGIDKVKGMVLFNDAPLKEVIVKLIGKTGILLDTTDQTGDFSFTIPEQMQNNEYQIWFTKEGFKTKSAPAFPQTGEPLNIVMEKR